MVVRVQNGIQRGALPRPGDARDQHQPLLLMLKAYCPGDVGMEFKVLIRPDLRVNRTHVESKLIEIEIRVCTEPVHMIVLHHRIREVKITILIQKLTLAFKQNALDEDVYFIERERRQCRIRLLIAMNAIPDLPLRPVTAKID